MLELLSVNDETPQLDSIKDWLLKHIEFQTNHELNTYCSMG